jgi:hypothetical protein
VTLPQLVADGFVDKVLGGQFDNSRDQRPAGGYRGPDDKPPAEGWKGKDADDLEYTRRKMIQQLQQEVTQ